MCQKRQFTHFVYYYVSGTYLPARISVLYREYEAEK